MPRRARAYLSPPGRVGKGDCARIRPVLNPGMPRAVSMLKPSACAIRARGLGRKGKRASPRRGPPLLLT